MITQKYLEACDASAATWIAGTSFFVTASDEDYLLRIYDSRAPGAPIDRIDVTDFLDPSDRSKEPDIEGCAQVGNRMYWIGSHGRDKAADEQESRQRLFATEITIVSGRPRLRPIGTPYRRLLRDLAEAPELATFRLADAAALSPEAVGGLNIEGLAGTPEGHLLVGFRNPIPQGRALIARIQNPAEVIAGGHRAEVTRGALLDLGGRGLRALEATASGDYYILAGSADDERNFAIFRWDGQSDTPSLLHDDPTLHALNPEELLTFEVGGSPALMLFSDDGDAPAGNKKCKKADVAVRSFRVATLQLGS